MLICRRADELHIDVHGVARSLHRALENLGDAELLCDFPQVLRLGPIAGRRRARDDLERADLGELRQNFVLNTFGKKRVVLIAAQIFKWKDRNRTLLRRRSMCAFVEDKRDRSKRDGERCSDRRDERLASAARSLAVRNGDRRDGLLRAVRCADCGRCAGSGASIRFSKSMIAAGTRAVLSCSIGNLL